MTWMQRLRRVFDIDTRAMFTKHDFWAMPSTIEDQGLDGSQWIFEVATKNRYHVVNRWSPGSGPVVQL